jgi:hypothetical protein
MPASAEGTRTCGEQTPHNLLVSGAGELAMGEDVRAEPGTRFSPASRRHHTHASTHGRARAGKATTQTRQHHDALIYNSEAAALSSGREDLTLAQLTYQTSVHPDLAANHLE